MNKPLSLFLSVVLAVSSFPFPVLGSEAPSTSILLDPTEYNLPDTAVELPFSRSLQSAVFSLGGRKRAAVSVHANLFTEDADGNVVYASHDASTIDGHHVFNRLPQGTTVSFNLSKPSYTYEQGGKSYSVRFEGTANAEIDGNTVSYQLSPNERLVWTVDNMTVRKQIFVTKTTTQPNISFTVSSDTLTPSLLNGGIAIEDIEGVFGRLSAPTLENTDGTLLDTLIELSQHENTYTFVYDDTFLPDEYVIDPSSTRDAGSIEGVDYGGGTVTWANEANGLTDDGSVAKYTGGGGDSQLLKYYNFGFSATVAAGATIDGIEVHLDGANNYQRSDQECDVHILDASRDPTGTSKDCSMDANSNESWTSLTLGGSSDTWSASPTATMVRDTDFGVGVQAKDQFGFGTDMDMDHLQITIHYTAPAATLDIRRQNTTISNEEVMCHTDFISTTLPAAKTIYFVFDQSVTGFTASDISVVNGTKGSLAGSGDSYSMSITATASPMTVSVSSDVVNEGNNSDSRGFTFSEHFIVCDFLTESADNVLWKLDETSGTTADDSIDLGVESAAADQDLTLVGGGTWGELGATTSSANIGSILLDGTNDYLHGSYDLPVDGDSTFYVSAWVQSVDEDPSNGTILQLNNNDAVSGNRNLLTIAYRDDTTNYLHVSHNYNGTTSYKGSDTSFDITKWNKIVVKVTSSGIDSIWVNGSEVSTTVAQTGPTGTDEDKILLGVANNSSTLENYFNGRLDEVTFAEAIDGTDSNHATQLSANEQTSCYYITSLPSGISATLPNASDADPTQVGNKKCGTNTVRFFDTADSVVVTDAPIKLTQNRDMTSGADLVVDTNVTDTGNIPETPKSVASFHANHGKNGAKTLYVPKGSTSTFRVCPNATALGDISDSCTNGVSFSSGETKSVTFPSGSNNVTVSTETISSVEYWKATGMLGSGGQGEGGGGDSGGGGGDVPDLSWWAVLFVLLGCGYVLHNRGMLEI